MPVNSLYKYARRFATLILTAVFICASTLTAFASDSNVRVGDELSVFLSSWSTATEEFRAWSDWPSSYTVNDTGTISLPFVGEITSIGKDPNDLAREISATLKDALSPLSLLSATVQIDARQPILVHGFVRNAGEVEYRVGMTAREAIAAAGGILSPGAAGDFEMLRSQVRSESTIRELSQREDQLTARAARLSAQVIGREDIDFPEFLDSKRGDDLSARERELFALDREKRSRTVALIDGRVDLLNSEIASLEEQLESLEAQRVVDEENFVATRQLSERGLSVNARLFDAQRALSSIETQILGVNSEVWVARQDIAEAERDRLDVLQGETSRSLSELQTVLPEKAQTREKRLAEQRLLSFSGMSGLSFESLKVTVVNQGERVPRSVAIDTVLQPGAIVEFTVPNAMDQVIR